MLWLISAVCLAVVGVQTRMMQSVSSVLIVLYYSLLVVLLIAAIILFNGITETTSLMHYSQDQLLATIVPGFFYTGAIYSLTIAMQNERPGFVILLGYMGLVYTHVGHTFMQSSTFYG